MAYLQIDDLRVEYEKDNPVLDGYGLSVQEGELVSLLGPSGCGKTTILRTVAGFIEPVRGRVVIAGQDNTRLPPHRRDIGLVFQSYALFPHLTVFENVAFGLRMRGVRGEEMAQRVQEALTLVDLGGFEDRQPGQLSGGQRQRVAVARAIVIEPKLLLMDEPLSNLDAKLRVGMRASIRRLQQQLGTTMLYVTHDQLEALTLSDRIVVMNRGRIEQIGTPEEIFQRPATSFVADFMGFDNHFQAKVESVTADTIALRTGSHRLQAKVAHPQDGLVENGEVGVYFRPETANVSAEPVDNSIPGSILFRTFHGSSMEYIIRTDLGEFTVHQSGEDEHLDMGTAHVVLSPGQLILIPAGAP